MFKSRVIKSSFYPLVKMINGNIPSLTNKNKQETCAKYLTKAQSLYIKTIQVPS